MGLFKVPDVWTRGESNPCNVNLNITYVTKPGPNIRLAEYRPGRLIFLNEIITYCRKFSLCDV